MNFGDILNDIKKLIGLELKSIRPGANITILDADDSKSCILIKTSSGAVRSRPYSELQRIWEELLNNKAIHVEGVLHGSGTSRNQPETIFANLPYVEWLKVNNKKNIAFVGTPTHAYGTLKQMDPFSAADLVASLSADSEFTNCVGIIITDDIFRCTETLISIQNGATTAVEQGVYKVNFGEKYFLCVSKAVTSLELGTYCVTNTPHNLSHPTLYLCGKPFYAINKNGAQILAYKE